MNCHSASFSGVFFTVCWFLSVAAQLFPPTLTADENAFKYNPKRVRANYIVVHCGESHSVMSLRPHPMLFGDELLPDREGPFAIELPKALELTRCSSVKELLNSPARLLALLRECDSTNADSVSIDSDVLFLGSCGGSSSGYQFRGIDPAILTIESREIRIGFPVAKYFYAGPETGDSATLLVAAIGRIKEGGEYRLTLSTDPCPRDEVMPLEPLLGVIHARGTGSKRMGTGSIVALVISGGAAMVAVAWYLWRRLGLRRIKQSG